jgi:hypothetical protein
MAIIKIDGRAVSNHWITLTDNAGNIYNRINPPSFAIPSPEYDNSIFLSSKDFPTESIPMFNLEDGEYFINPQNDSHAIAFTVSGSSVDYDSSLTFLSGIGTDTLTLSGYDVTIDARYLVAKGLAFSGVLGFGAGDPSGKGAHQVIYTTCTLLPGKNYFFTVAAGIHGDFNFNVENNGTITMRSEYAGFMSIKPGNVVEIVGFPILIDGRLNGETEIELFGVFGLFDAAFPDNHTPWSESKVIMGNFAPSIAAHRFIRLRSAGGLSGVSSEGFRINNDGTIEVSDTNFLKVDEFNGIRRITVLKALPNS